MYCSSCGTKNPDGAAACGYCGAPLSRRSQPAPTAAPETVLRTLVRSPLFPIAVAAFSLLILTVLIGGILLFPNELREEENLATDDIVVFLLFCASLLTVCVCGIFTAIRLWKIYAFCRKNRPLTNVSLTPVKVQTTVTTILILSWAIATPVCSVLYALPNFNFYVLRALLYLLFIVGAVFTWRVVSFRCIWKTLSALDAILQKNAVSRDRMLFNAIRLLGYLGVTFYMAVFWTFMIPDSVNGWTLYWSLIGHFGFITCLCGAVLLLKANARLRLLEQTY